MQRHQFCQLEVSILWNDASAKFALYSCISSKVSELQEAGAAPFLRKKQLQYPCQTAAHVAGESLRSNPHATCFQVLSVASADVQRLQ